MIKQGKKYCLKRDGAFALLIALLYTALMFSIFIIEIITTGHMLLDHDSDTYRLVFPAFCQAWKVVKGISVDIATWNGATEILSRANLPLMYPPFVAFSCLGKIIGFEAAYILYYAAHMFLFEYFSILLALRDFSLNRPRAVAFALSASAVLLSAVWYCSFYTIAALTVPILYFSIKALKRHDLASFVLSSLLYLWGFLSGYIPVSVFLCGLIFVLTVVYGICWKEDLGMTSKNAIVRAIIPVALAGVAVVAYYLQVVHYISKIVDNTGNAFWEIADLPFRPKDWITIISSAFYPVNSIEMYQLPHIGMCWAAAMALAFVSRHDEQTALMGKKKYISFSVITMYIVLLLASASTSSIFSYWFYSIPIFGQMHLPVRYYCVIMPFFFLVLSAYLPSDPKQKPAALVLLVTVGILLLLISLGKRTYSDKLDENILSVELLLLCVFLLVYYKAGLNHLTAVLLALGVIMYPFVGGLYKSVVLPEDQLRSISIVYDEAAEDSLQEFIRQLPEQDRYKYVTLDEAAYNNLPGYVPNNYSWYEHSESTLSEYYGYEAQLSGPKEYRERMPWYNRIDWAYVADTRGDFAVITPATMEAQADSLQTIIDWDWPQLQLPNGSTVYKLKKFVPCYYTGEEFVEETTEDVLDNGYFYCPNLTQADLIDFQTDKTSRYSAVIDSDAANDIAFTLYPNWHYHYYVDGVETEPVIYDMQVFIPIPPGEHTIDIVYKNTLSTVSNAVFICYCAFAVVALGCFAVKNCRKKKRV